MKNIFNQQGLDKLVLRMGEKLESVKKNEKGLPVEWRVFKYGPVSITKDGVSLSGEFQEEHADKIMEHFNNKKSKLPIDANHMLYLFAEQHKRDEREVAAMTGETSLAMGFGALEKREDGLWITDVEWLPLGAELMGEKVFRYFSPVLRGLSDGNLRITSLSVLNNPGIDGQDAIAAASEAITPAIQSVQVQATENAQDSAILAKVKDVLKLSADDGKDALLGALQGVMIKIADYDKVKERLDAIELEAEKKKKDDLIQEGLRDGKLTNDMVERWAKEQSSIALSAFLKAAPKGKSVPLDKLDRSNLNNDDDVELSEADRKVCDTMGLSAEEFLKTKKANAK